MLPTISVQSNTRLFQASLLAEMAVERSIEAQMEVEDDCLSAQT
jgi:hypothetical protein